MIDNASPKGDEQAMNTQWAVFQRACFKVVPQVTAVKLMIRAAAGAPGKQGLLLKGCRTMIHRVALTAGFS